MPHKLFGGTLHSALVHAVTEYDRRESTKRGYNYYALGQYLIRLEEIEADIADGMPTRTALLRAFNGRLLDHLLKAVGEPKYTRDEMFAQPLTYSR